MTDVQGILVTFLDQTGAKSIKARIAPTVAVSKIIPNIITKMSLPITAPDGQPMSYSLDHKEGGKRLQETQTLPDAGVKEGDHLIVYPEIVAGALLMGIDAKVMARTGDSGDPEAVVLSVQFYNEDWKTAFLSVEEAKTLRDKLDKAIRSLEADHRAPGDSSFTVRSEVKADVEHAARSVEHQPVFALSLLVNASGRLSEHVKTLGGIVVGLDWPTAQGYRIVKD